MKKVFFAGVIVYSIALLVLSDVGTAMDYSGGAALPWIAKCLIDLCFAGAGALSIWGDQIAWDDEEEGIHAEDLKVPSLILYPIFSLNLILNFGYHVYKAAVTTEAASLYYLIWVAVEFFAILLTVVLYKHALDINRRARRKAGGITNLNRSA